MASRFEEPDIAECTQCENCGATDDLLRCSRCHAAWFCSLKCHKAYWPFHKQACKRNDFADAVEQQEPKFAAWMRAHGKLAVLQDEEVDRLERSSKPGGWQGLRRGEVLESMYGRMDPSPARPTYNTVTSLRVVDPSSSMQQSDPDSSQLLSSTSSATERAWRQLQVPDNLGIAATNHKWRQNLSHVEVFVRLPESVAPKQVHVTLSTRQLCVMAAGDELLSGHLAADIKVEDSTWFCGQRMGAHYWSKKLRANTAHGAGSQNMSNSDDTWKASSSPSKNLLNAGMALHSGLNCPDFPHAPLRSNCIDADDGIVHLQLLKRNRKGNYQDGSSAADTFWFSLFAGARGMDRLQLTHPPTRYYSMSSENC